VKTMNVAEGAVILEGDSADLYMRYAQAAARLRAAGTAYEQAKSDYTALLAQFTASAEKQVTG
jgi:hypothetical protein